MLEFSPRNGAANVCGHCYINGCVYTHVYKMFMGPLGMRLTFKLEILPVVMFQRCSNCARSKYVMKQAVIGLKDWGEIPPSALLQVKKKEDCIASFY